MTSVKQKIAGIEKEREKIQSGIRKIESSVAKLKSDIKGQTKINAAAAQEMGAGIQKIHGAIREQASVNKAYIKDFYFGEGKK